MTTFKDIQKILDDAIDNASAIGAHGTFWRDVTRDQFVGLNIFGCPIIYSQGGMFNGPLSPLVKILRGPTNCQGLDFPQMPFGFNPVSKEKVQTISDWIDAQCPV